MTEPRISVILATREGPHEAWPTVRSIRAQPVPAEIIVVTSSSGGRSPAPGHEVDEVVELPAADWTPGRALNVGAAAARAPIHATLVAGRELPRSDWLSRLEDHLQRPEIAGASGARSDPKRRVLLDPRDVRAADWTPAWGFSTSAGGWRAATWRKHPFPEAATAAEGAIWAWNVLREGGTLVVDPFLQLTGSPPYRVRAATIFRRTSDEWASLVAAETPVTVPTLRDALGTWWHSVDSAVAAPAALQRLNYFRLARELGRWFGARRTAGRSAEGSRGAG